MVGLLDIAPVAEKVTVRGRQLHVYGVSAKGLAYLIGRFPEIRQMMVGKSVDASRLLAIGGDAVEAIIAAVSAFPAMRIRNARPACSRLKSRRISSPPSSGSPSQTE